MKKLGIGIIGTGLLGGALAYRLSRAGWRIAGLFDIDPEKARSVARIIPTGAFDSAIHLAKKSDILFLTVPDSEIISVAEELGDYGNFRARFIFHTCGILPSRILKLAGLERAVFSIHPITPISRDYRKMNPFAKTFFGCEGEKPAEGIARKIVSDLGGKYITINPEAKTLYHLSATLVSCNVFALYSTAERLLKKSGIEEENIREIISAMSRRALENYKSYGLKSLTGPVVRGDEGTIAQHLVSAEKENILKLYEAGIEELKKIVGGI